MRTETDHPIFRDSRVTSPGVICEYHLVFSRTQQLNDSSYINSVTSGAIALALSHLPAIIDCSIGTPNGEITLHTNPLIPVLFHYVYGGRTVRGWSLDTSTSHHFYFYLRNFRPYLQGTQFQELERSKSIPCRMRGPFLDPSPNSHGILEKIYSVFIHTDTSSVESPVWTCVVFQDTSASIRPRGALEVPEQPCASFVKRPDLAYRNCALPTAPKNSMWRGYLLAGQFRHQGY